LENPTIPTIIKNVWISPFSGSLNYIWEVNLKEAKIALKEWVKTSFIPPQQEKQEKIEQLRKVQLQI